MPSTPKRKKPLTEVLRPPLAYMGIYPTAPFGNDSISSRSYVTMSFMGFYIIISSTFFVFETMTFQSFSDCFWITTTAMIMTFVCGTLIVKRENVFDLIDNFEDIIEQRKRHSK